MPLTPKGNKILAFMEKEYGAKKGKQVFYASINGGKINGVEEKNKTSMMHPKNLKKNFG